MAVLQLAACASPPIVSEGPATQAGLAATPWTIASGAAPGAPAWQHYKLPGKQPSQFSYVRKDGRDAMVAHSTSSASMVRQAVRIEPDELGSVRFSWKVPNLIAQADMALREMDDSPVRIVLAFEGDRSKFSGKNAMLSELARALTGEEMPFATLMYVWCNSRQPDSVIVNPRTDRIRKLVVESGTGKLRQWVDYERNIRADYEKAFGETPGALVGIGIMTDSDNTRSTIQAWYGPVTVGAFGRMK
ncbi:MAG: DUF3047 domain-containing protein [Polaromonas sp.]|uniref:DUF3047 domain-containing protein n=1 Tax=Polaromonas sp. TaxID=1869339 RepID=UPI0027368DC7|nr:DUF3047 domain-containing protein [Polaromonas sp.]MDP2819109.1 DUF3047 domain-containing protein [Polaromonas sp.]